jgi:2-hydroxycyclohexanecarboxyl-CoA dehydrogenase
MNSLKNKVILIPGASGGIGREVARVFLDKGCNVALGYHSNEAPVRAVHEYAQSLGQRAMLTKVELSGVEGAGKWVKAVMAEFGRIDALASCIGAPLPEGFSPFVKQDPRTWERTIAVELMSVIYLCQPVLEQMLLQGHGRIVVLSSDGGKVGESGVAVSNAGNAGLIGFIKCIAREVGRNGITANLICPGPIDGPTMDSLRNRGDSGARVIEEMIRRVPMKRLGTGQDLGNAMAFLASDEAAYITGQAISVSGGLVMS